MRRVAGQDTDGAVPPEGVPADDRDRRRGDWYPESTPRVPREYPRVPREYNLAAPRRARGSLLIAAPRASSAAVWTASIAGTKGLLNAIANVLLEMSQDGEDEDGEVATDTHAPRAHALACARTHTRWRVHTQTWAELAKQIVIGDMKVPIALSELPIYTQMCVLRIDSPASRRDSLPIGSIVTRHIAPGLGGSAQVPGQGLQALRATAGGVARPAAPRPAVRGQPRRGCGVGGSVSPIYLLGRAHSRRGCGHGGEPSPGAGGGDLL
jgi:hypothetical protein